MTAIASNFAPIGRADQLGTALQQGLPRPLNPKLSWSLIHTLIVGGISGGILPLLVLPGRFKDFVRAEQMQYWHLAEWMRLQGGGKDADAATAMSQKLVPAFWLPLLARCFVIAAIGIGISAVRDIHHGEISHWQAWTNLVFHQGNGFESPKKGIHPGSSVPSYDPNADFPVAGTEARLPAHAPVDLMRAFDLAILGASLCLLIQINGHVARVQQFVGSFNQLTNHYGVGAVRPPGLQLGIRPVWIVAMVAMGSIGAFWAVPMLLATAAQRNYVIRSTRRLRFDLARRQRDVLLCRRPAVHVPSSGYLAMNCSQLNCRAPLPPEAIFCRRCGTRCGPGGRS